MLTELNIAETGFYLSHFLLFSLLAISSYTDWKYRKIYNKVTVSGLLAGLFLSAFGNFPYSLGNALLASAVAFAIFFILFMLGQMGGGDVKLVAAIGAFSGFPLILNVLLWGIIAGGVYALLASLWRGKLWENIKRALLVLGNLVFWRSVSSFNISSAQKIPYGICISAGTVIAFFLK
jgi:prepilin peptidase CpaA